MKKLTSFIKVWATRRRIRSIVKKDESISDEIEKVVQESGPEGVDALICELKSSNPKLRKICAETLGEMKAKTAASALRWLASIEKNIDVRVSAITALGELGDDAAVEGLMYNVSGSMKSPETHLRRSCAIALGNIKAQRAAEALFLATKDEDISVRVHAAISLAKIGDKRAGEQLMRNWLDSFIAEQRLRKEPAPNAEMPVSVLDTEGFKLYNEVMMEKFKKQIQASNYKTNMFLLRHSMMEFFRLSHLHIISFQEKISSLDYEPSLPELYEILLDFLERPEI